MKKINLVLLIVIFTFLVGCSDTSEIDQFFLSEKTYELENNETDSKEEVLLAIELFMDERSQMQEDYSSSFVGWTYDDLLPDTQMEYFSINDRIPGVDYYVLKPEDLGTMDVKNGALNQSRYMGDLYVENMYYNLMNTLDFEEATWNEISIDGLDYSLYVIVNDGSFVVKGMIQDEGSTNMLFLYKDEDSMEIIYFSDNDFETQVRHYFESNERLIKSMWIDRKTSQTYIYNQFNLQDNTSNMMNVTVDNGDSVYARIEHFDGNDQTRYTYLVNSIEEGYIIDVLNEDMPYFTYDDRSGKLYVYANFVDGYDYIGGYGESPSLYMVHDNTVLDTGYFDLEASYNYVTLVDFMDEYDSSWVSNLGDLNTDMEVDYDISKIVKDHSDYQITVQDKIITVLGQEFDVSNSTFYETMLNEWILEEIGKQGDVV